MLRNSKTFSKTCNKKCEQEPDEYVSCKLISKLKSLNKDMFHLHSERESLNSDLFVIASGCYMGSLDLKDTYYSPRIYADSNVFKIRLEKLT